jgi:peptide/nickel transport system substrate-binding protein
MAEGYSRSDDGRTYLIRLRDGLKFHDGEPARAQDCAASLKRCVAREVVGQTAAEFVDAWGAQDDRTIRITMKLKPAIFMDLIGHRPVQAGDGKDRLGPAEIRAQRMRARCACGL